MKSLETIQKTFKVFQTLIKIAEIFCIVGASICAVTALCAGAWYNGGQVFSFFGNPIETFIHGDMVQAYVKLISLTFTISADAILLGFAHSYLKHEIAEGTPFTEKGAKRLKMLGIRCIYVPVIAVAISEILAIWQCTESAGEISNLPGVAVGIVLILTSLVFRYGAELDSGNKTGMR